MTNALAGTAQELSETTPGSGTSSPNTGWTQAKSAAPNMSKFIAQTKTSGTFGTGPFPTAALAAVNALRSTNSYLGTFDAGDWVFTAMLIAVSSASTQRGRFRIRIFASTGADGTGSRELTAAVVIGTTQAAAPTAAVAQSSVVTAALGSVTLNNEYLWVSAAWEITTAGGTTTADQVLRIGSANTRLLTPNFTAGGASLTQTVDDTVSLSDSVAPSRGINISIDDNASLSDSISGSADFQRTIAEATLSIADAIAIDRGLTIADTVAIADSIVAGLLKLVTIDDVLALSDAIAIGQGKVIADTLALADLVSTIAVFNRTQADTVSLSDALSAVVTAFRTQDDSVSVSDAIALTAAFSRTLSDTVSVSDSISTSLSGGAQDWERNIDDVVSLADVLSIVSDFNFNLDDSVDIADTIMSALSIDRSFADTVGLSDSITPVLTPGGEEPGAWMRSVVDTVSIADSFSISVFVGAEKILAGRHLRPELFQTGAVSQSEVLQAGVVSPSELFQAGAASPSEVTEVAKTRSGYLTEASEE